MFPPAHGVQLALMTTVEFVSHPEAEILLLRKAIREAVRAKYNLHKKHAVEVWNSYTGLHWACWNEPKPWWQFWKRKCICRITKNSLEELLEEVNKEHPGISHSYV